MKHFIQILDFLFLHPIFKSYYRSRIEAIIINNLGRSGLTVFEYIDGKFRTIYGIVIKYPNVRKFKIKKEIFDSNWPGLMDKIKLVANKQKESIK